MLSVLVGTAIFICSLFIKYNSSSFTKINPDEQQTTSSIDYGWPLPWRTNSTSNLGGIIAQWIGAPTVSQKYDYLNAALDLFIYIFSILIIANTLNLNRRRVKKNQAL